MSRINPIFDQFTIWKAPTTRSVRVQLPHGFRPIRNQSPTSPLIQARIMIKHVLMHPEIERFYSPGEIDRVLNDEVLAKYGGGRYFSPVQNPKLTLTALGHWADLINNKIVGVLGNIQYLEMSVRDGQIPQEIIDEVMPDIQDCLRELKAIEDWISYNPAFMRQIVSQPIV